MVILQNINVLRRQLIYKITNNTGKSAGSHQVDLNKKIEIKRILICRPNHRLGNLLLITPLVEEVIATFPDCEIDLFIKGNFGPIVFKNYKNVQNIYNLPRKPFKEIFKYFKVWMSIKKSNYDLVINVVIRSLSGRLSTKYSNNKYKVMGDVEQNQQFKYDNYEHIAKKPIYSLRNYLTKLGYVEANRGIPSINLKLSTLELAAGKKIVDELVDSLRKTISIFTYATDDKCHSKAWWLNFYEKLISEFPNYNILEVLPVENISMINFKAPSFYSKDIREMASVFANTSIFIGADSGIMHLASSSLIPVVGLFSRANQKEYQPFNQNSIAINTNYNDADAIIAIVREILNKN